MKFLLARDVYKTSKLTLGRGSPHESRSPILDSDNVCSRKKPFGKVKRSACVYRQKRVVEPLEADGMSTNPQALLKFRGTNELRPKPEGVQPWGPA